MAPTHAIRSMPPVRRRHQGCGQTMLDRTVVIKDDIEERGGSLRAAASRRGDRTTSLRDIAIGIPLNSVSMHDEAALTDAIAALAHDDRRVGEISCRAFSGARVLAPTPEQWCDDLLRIYESKLATARSSPAKRAHSAGDIVDARTDGVMQHLSGRVTEVADV